MAMILGTLSRRDLARKLADGITLTTGPFKFRLQSRQMSVAHGLATLYADFPLEEDAGVRDFHVRVDTVPGVRGWIKPQVNFWLDGNAPFKPLPANHAFAMLEWGMNWCIAGHAHHYLLLTRRRGGTQWAHGDPARRPWSRQEYPDRRTESFRAGDCYPTS